MSYRLTFCFQLDMDKPDHEEVADIIELLKNERGYASAIRDGLRLVWSLRRGDVGVLYELYPDISQYLQMQYFREYIDSAIDAKLSARADYSPAPPPAIAAPSFDDDDDHGFSAKLFE